jgi:hypothetical protein
MFTFIFYNKNNNQLDRIPDKEMIWMELNIYDLLNSKNFKHKHLNLKDELESLKKDLLIKKENFIDNPFLKKYMALNTFNVNEPVRFMKDSFTGNIGISNIIDEKSELYMVSDNVPVDVKRLKIMII